MTQRCDTAHLVGHMPHILHFVSCPCLPIGIPMCPHMGMPTHGYAYTWICLPHTFACSSKWRGMCATRMSLYMACLSTSMSATRMSLYIYVWPYRHPVCLRPGAWHKIRGIAAEVFPQRVCGCAAWHKTVVQRHDVLRP